MHIDVLASDLGFTEGPVWLPDGRIALTSISHGCLYILDPSGGPVERIVTGVDNFVNSSDTQELTMVLRGAGEDLRVVLADTRTLVNGADAEVQGLASKIDPTLANLDAAIARGNDVLDALNRQIGTDSETQYELVNTLNEIQGAARALRVLLEYLERNPEAILRGKKE